MGRTATRLTPTRSDAPEAGAPKKTRLRKNASQRSILDLPTEIVNTIRFDYGQDLQWVTDSIYGKPEAAMRQGYEMNAWEPVTGDMFDGLLDGMYMKKGHTGEITYDGLVLMYRPYELTLEAMAEDSKAREDALRAQQNMVTGGNAIQGLAPGFEASNPAARHGNIFSRQVRPPMDIPKD